MISYIRKSAQKGREPISIVSLRNKQTKLRSTMPIMEPRLWIAALESGGGKAAAAGPAKQDFGDEAGPREAEKPAV